MSSDAAKQRHQAAAATGNLNVIKYAESRAGELESLKTIIGTRLNNDYRSRRNKRRRTTSFQRKKAKYISSSSSSSRKAETQTEEDEKKKAVGRRVRRRIELKKNPLSGFVVSGDGTKRLPTHLWHSKRFSLLKLWGFYLPSSLHGCGRGSRSLLKSYRQGALVHDASFFSVLQLTASQEALLSVLGKLLVPFLTDYSEDLSQRILSGQSFGRAMLHHDAQDSSKAICPVTYVWRPFQQHENYIDTKDERNIENVETEAYPNHRQIWIWMHPSASAEGLECLKLVCQKMQNETGVVVDCVSLDGQLGRIEVMGEGAFKLLQKILHPLTFSSEKSRTLKNCSMVEHTDGREVEQSSILEKEECFSSHAVVSLKVVDPRLSSSEVVSRFPDAHIVRDLGGLSEEKDKESCAGNQYKKDDVLFTLQSKFESITSLSNCNDLWDASKVIQPPVEEHHLCQERHKKSLDFFCLKDASSEISTRNRDVSILCPILLMRHNHRSGLPTRWSIVLPISWVKAFWTPLVSRGAHAIGLREKHWISCDVGLPYFPSDFPDCNAYSCFMASEAEKVEQTMECRPPAMRPFKIPKLLPWTSRCFAFNDDGRQSSRMGNIGVNGDHSAYNCSESIDVPPSGSFEILVARTCGALSSFLKEISADHMLLFPKRLNKDDFSHLMKDETKISQASGVIALARHGSKLCYLRVLLHAFKEGVFGEGAVVCAPRFSDISLWTSSVRSEDDARLQVPDAFVGSYFEEESSGKWEFQLPKDAAAMEAYRRPIGFVTTGFVRGSKRPSAVGLCEALLLAQLRLDQWSRTSPKKRRKEIFVLVRNLRSTAYRLALATIVLEEQEDDVDSL